MDNNQTKEGSEQEQRDQDKCTHLAYGLLVRREHARQELYWKLKQRPSCRHVDLDILLDQLEAENYLSDERYTEVAVRYDISKGYGPTKIACRLREKGVNDVYIQRYLYAQDINWILLITTVRQKRFGIAIPNDLKDRAKQSRFLAGRGFTTDMIRNELSL
jgi:regulatory protein